MPLFFNNITPFIKVIIQPRTTISKTYGKAAPSSKRRHLNFFSITCKCNETTQIDY